MRHDTRGEEATGGGPRLLVGLGCLFVLTIVGEWALMEVLRPMEHLTTEYALALLLNGVPALGISYGGYWLARSDVEPDQYRRVVRWCVGGLVAFLSLNLVMIAVWPAEGLRANLGWARGTAIFGAVGGLLVGGIEARTVRRARAAEREIAHTEYVESQRRWLGYLNSLLRHEVLNTANVIEGYSELLIDEGPDGLAADRLEIIRRQSRNLTEVIDDVRVLLEATEEPEELEVQNLSTVLADRVAELRARNPEADVRTAVSDDVFVRADSLLPRVFSNLLHNAVDHHDGDSPVVSVSVETTDETAVVSIADDGPGVPEAKRDSIFEGDVRSSNHGLGLYLVRTLAERYDGAVELRETGPNGSVFAVELPRVGRSTGGFDPVDAVVPAAIAGRTG
ncbi:ATP-binding protein [Halogeometricum luteum]|uniref:histidine kinase n=1 Tax=Halogeometricum luteum TaxID=2950537 RepID=A0ABU2G178_9EURY|nr:ATP-binding protein [Halogeometricum sp. S3BR5-2]MDS0294540.1 ATP-binding protein [Halogeometricum sp. S3BR5-2]